MFVIIEDGVNWEALNEEVEIRLGRLLRVLQEGMGDIREVN